MKFLIFFWMLIDFFFVNGLFGFFFNFLRLLLTVTKVTTGHQQWPKIGQNSNKKKRAFPPQGQKKPSAKRQSPPQELEVGPRRGSYLLVYMIRDDKVYLKTKLFCDGFAKIRRASMIKEGYNTPFERP